VAAFFSRRGTHQLTDVAFESGNEYGAAIAISLDGQPLSNSRKILVQYTTRSRPTGWQERAAQIATEAGGNQAGFEILDFGKAPWKVQEAKLKVSLKTKGITSASVLDANFMPRSAVTLTRTTGGETAFEFPKSALYVILTG